MKHSRRKDILSIVSIVLSVLCHIGIIAFIVLSFRYYSIYPSIFASLAAIVLLVMIITDIILFIGLNTKDKGLRITNIVLSVLLIAGSVFGSFYITKVNSAVEGILDGSKDSYETVSGVFVSYKTEYGSLENMNATKVGYLEENTEGVASVGLKLLDDAKIDYAPIPYNSYKEIFQSLLDHDIDVGIMLNGYRSMFANDENMNYAQHMDDMVDNYTFEQQVKVNSSKSTKNISTEPFNVLLIGWSRVELGSSVGLADAIILATVNPQTYTVSMMSIARDSFVPISCYGGSYDKINSGRSTSRACFIETVEDFINTGNTGEHIDIDFYMEADYDAIIRIVDRIDGIDIYNPVEFTLDGVYVPQGYVHANGVQALEFCRERHHMPNGDFDRQQHQKEVIMAIARKMITSGDLSVALYAMQGAGDQMSTDLTLSQLTSLFNMLLNTKNYTGLDTFDLVDFQTLRITGYGGIMYYSYSMRLPLWVYLIYQGSFDESMAHVKEAMGQYDRISQENSFAFSARNPYVRPAFYSTEYEQKFMFEPDPMPPYWATLEGMPYADAMQWAAENGVGLSVSFITAGDPRYDATQDGMVVEQTPRHGALISEYPTGSIVVMGTGELDESKQVPNFVGKSYYSAIEWANRYGVRYSYTWDNDGSAAPGTVISQSHSAYTPISEVGTFTFVVKNGSYKVQFNNNGKGTFSHDPVTIRMSDEETVYFSSGSYLPGDVTAAVGDPGDYYKFVGWFTNASGGDQITNSDQISADTTLYAHWELICNHSNATDEITQPATCSAVGIRTWTCPKCSYSWTEEISKLDHTWGEWIEDLAPQIGVKGSRHRECSVCHAIETEEIPALVDEGGEGGGNGEGN